MAPEHGQSEKLQRACASVSSKRRRSSPFFSLEGYIEPAGPTTKWRTTDAGRIISGAKTPRFTPGSIEAALNALQGRIDALNADPTAIYSATRVVAFGDFLRELPRVQAASVGIQFDSRRPEPPSTEAKGVKATLKQLRGGSAMLDIQAYEPWMGARSHRDLV